MKTLQTFGIDSIKSTAFMGVIPNHNSRIPPQL
jgi:hypothetical protein